MGRPLENKGPYWAIGQRLKAALDRKSLGGKSYVEIGKKLGNVSHTTIGNWINGKKLPKSEHLLMLATELNISIDWLLTGQGEMDIPVISGEVLVISTDLPQEARATIQGIVDLYSGGVRD